MPTAEAISSIVVSRYPFRLNNATDSVSSASYFDGSTPTRRLRAGSSVGRSATSAVEIAAGDFGQHGADVDRGQLGTVVDDAADHAQHRRRKHPALSRGESGPKCHERPLNSVVHRPHLAVQRRLVVTAKVASLPPVQPARLTVGQRSVGDRGDQPLQRVRVGLRIVGERRARHELLAERKHRVAKEVVLARVVPVKGGRRDPDPRGDRLHADRVIAQRAECLRGRARDLGLPILRSTPDACMRVRTGRDSFARRVRRAPWRSP